jgi:hypothetical protein
VKRSSRQETRRMAGERTLLPVRTLFVNEWTIQGYPAPVIFLPKRIISKIYAEGKYFLFIIMY